MGMWIGRNRKARVTYGFDEIALVPGEVTINPNEVDTCFQNPAQRRQRHRAENPHHRQRDGRRDRRAVLHRDGQARRPGRHQPGRRANPLRKSRRSAGPNRQGRQGGRHHAHPEILHRTDQGGIDRPARRGIEKSAACWPPSVPFRKRRSVSAASRRKRARTFLSCNPPFRPSNIFPPNTNRWIWPISAGR